MPGNHSGGYLREVYHYPGHASIIAQAAKKKGMRFDVSSFKDCEVTYTKDNIMILRGGAAEFLDRLFECGPSRISRKQSALLFLRRHTGILASRCYHAFDLLRRNCSYAHNRKIPSNDVHQWRRPEGGRYGTGVECCRPLHVSLAEFQ
jgi:hypothetical protein